MGEAKATGWSAFPQADTNRVQPIKIKNFLFRIFCNASAADGYNRRHSSGFRLTFFIESRLLSQANGKKIAKFLLILALKTHKSRIHCSF